MTNGILVLGATGTIGKHVVSDLVARGETVKAATLDGSPHPDAEAVFFDFRDPRTIAPLFEGVDRVFVSMPAAPLEVIDALMPVMLQIVERRIKAVLLSMLGVETLPDNPYRRLETVLENSGLPFVVLRANWFADNFRSEWKDDVLRGELALPAGEGLVSLIDARDIAAAAAVALTSSEFDGRAHALTGPAAVTLDRAAEVLGQAMGRKVVYRPIDGPDYETRLRERGLTDNLVEQRLAEFDTIRSGAAAIVSPSVEMMTGRPARFFETFVKDYATDFVAA